MLYMVAGEPEIDQRLLWDLNELEAVGSSRRVTIVAQFDPLDTLEAKQSTTTKRYHFSKDPNLFVLHSEPVADLGELDMTDPQVLSDFVMWAVEAYPAKHRMLVFAGHGSGWHGVLIDDSSPTPSVMMPLEDLAISLDSSLRAAGINRLEIIGFSACLMGQLEVLASLEPYCSYVVSSECTECALGWGYDGLLAALTEEPTMGPAEFAVAIVENQIAGDAFVTSKAARVVDFLRSWLLPEEFTPDLIERVGRMSHHELDQLCETYGIDAAWIPTAEQKALQPDAQADFATIAAFDLEALPEVLAGVRALGDDLRALGPERADAIRAACRGEKPGCWDVFEYVDLPRLAVTVASHDNGSGDLTGALEDLIIARRSGSEVEDLGGLSIYFPTVTACDSATWTSYSQAAERFVEQTGWDNALRSLCEIESPEDNHD